MITSSLLLCALLAQTPAAPPPSGLITGRVTEGGGDSGVPSAVVSIQASTSQQRDPLDLMLTDSDGRFFFEGLASGTYRITVRKPGWIDGAYGQRRAGGLAATFTLENAERRTGLDIKLWKPAVLAGDVTDEAGEPVVDALVWAVRRRSIAGRQRMELVTATHTDDRGAFRLSGLAPGEYTAFLPTMISSGPMTFSPGSAPMPWMRTMTTIGAAPLSVERTTATAVGDRGSLLTGMLPLDGGADRDGWTTWPPTFLGATSATSATFVTLEPGQRHEGASIALRRVPTHTISGQLAVPDGSPGLHALHLLPADLADFPLFDVGTAVTDPSGAFTFYGVPEGAYVVRIVKVPEPKGEGARGSTGYVDENRKFVSLSPGRGAPAIDPDPLLFASVPVTVGNAPVRGLAITLQTAPHIFGRVTFEGGAAPAYSLLQRAAIWVRPGNGADPYSRMPYAGIAEDLRFGISGVLPGAYVLDPMTLGEWTVKSVTVEGRDVTGRAIPVSSDLENVLITYSKASEKVSGAVTKDGQPDPDASVVMFPANPDEWSNTSSSAMRLPIGRATPATGAFSFAALPAGDYLIVAVNEADTGNWRDPAILAKLAAVAERVTVRFGEAVNVNLTTRSIR